MPIAGSKARPVVFGTLHSDTGPRLFLVCPRPRGEDFRAVRPLIRNPYRGGPGARIRGEDRHHPAADARDRAAA